MYLLKNSCALRRATRLGGLLLSFSLLTAPAGAQLDAEAEAEAEIDPLSEESPNEQAREESGDSSADDSEGALEPAASEGAEDELTVSQGGGLFESAAAGEEVLDGSSEDSADVGVSLDWGGYVRGDVFIGMIPKTTEPAINAAYGELSLQPRATAGSWGSAFADFRVRYGQQLDEYDLILDLREAYTSTYLGPFELRLGKQVVVWGRADAFNPTSNIAPIDFNVRSPIEDDRRLGTVGARAFLNFSSLKLEAVWMPLYEPTLYPPIEIEPYVRFVDPYYPTTSLRNGLVAGKLGLELSAFEASVSYLYGYAPLPGIDLATNPPDPSIDRGFTLSADAPNEVRVRRRAYRHHVIGADFAATPGDVMGIRAEGAYRLPAYYDPEERPWTAKPDVQWVVGLDKEFGPVMIIVQYLGRYTFDWEETREIDDSTTFPELMPGQEDFIAKPAIDDTLFNTNQMLFSQLYQLQTLFSARVEWKTLHEALSISALGLFNINTKEWLVTPKIGYNITGGLTAYLGAEIYYGPEGTLFDVIDDTLTAGYAELRLSF